MFVFKFKHICCCKTSCLCRTYSSYSIIWCRIMVPYREAIFCAAYFHHRYVKSMCRVTLTQCYNLRISNGALLRRLNLRAIDDYVTKWQLRWACHITRMDFDRLPRKMFSSWVCTKRPVDAPEYTYYLSW